MKRRSWAVPAYVCALASVIGLTFFAACTADDDDDSTGAATGQLSDGGYALDDCTKGGFECRDFYACQPDAGHIVGFTSAGFACTTPDYVCCSVGPDSCGGQETYSCEAPDGAITRPLCDVNALKCPVGSTPIGPIVVGGSDAGEGGDGGDDTTDASCGGDSGVACVVPCAQDRGTCTAATACGAGLPDDEDASATCGATQICCTHACSNEICRTVLGVVTTPLSCDSATGTLVCPAGSTSFKPDAGSITDAGADAADASDADAAL